MKIPLNLKGVLVRQIATEFDPDVLGLAPKVKAGRVL
jgi:hypothetical protein